MRTFRTPGSVCNNSSARSMGSRVPAIGEIASIGRGGVTGGALKGFAGTISKAGGSRRRELLGVLREGTARYFAADWSGGVACPHRLAKGRCLPIFHLPDVQSSENSISGNRYSLILR